MTSPVSPVESSVGPAAAGAAPPAAPERREISRPYPLPPLPPDRYYAEPLRPEDVGGGALTFVEDSDPFDAYHYRVRRVLHAGRTAHQEVLIADTLNYGRALVLDGAIQSSEDDEALYHEALVQPALLRHPDPRDVLILGGGEGATLREVLVHRSVRSATMVDLDREVVELCREHLPSWHRGAFDDPRARLVFGDGRRFVEEDDGLYDVVLIDVVDMLENGPAQALYTREFHERLRRRLRPGAIVVVQGLEFSFLDAAPHAALARTLRAVHPEVHSYRVHVPSFLSAWGFLVASDWLRPEDFAPAELDRSIALRLGGEWLDHLDGELVRSAFSLCKETRFLLGQAGPILEDGVPFVPPPDIEDVEPPVVRFPVQGDA